MSLLPPDHPAYADEYEYDEYGWENPAPDCFVCFGPLVELGTLGSLTWSRCRDCGQEQHA